MVSWASSASAGISCTLLSMLLTSRTRTVGGSEGGTEDRGEEEKSTTSSSQVGEASDEKSSATPPRTHCPELSRARRSHSSSLRVPATTHP